MTTKKKVTDVTTEAAETEVESLFSKEQILAAKSFKSRKDLLNTILSDDKEYTITTVERLIDDFLKGQVK